MLQIAWHYKDAKMELAAYDNIGTEYFYLGNLTKAKYYNDKVCFGEVEPAESIVRKVAVQILETKIERNENDEAKNGKKKSIFERMPSPSGFGQQSNESKDVGRNKINALLDEIPPHLLRKKVEGNEAKQYADFTMPELVHLNKPEFPNYLKSVK